DLWSLQRLHCFRTSEAFRGRN
ncbi:hypothetical protein A2U01_0111105, partial [Trifolium medium]|nr:hypothetical protein [Trifolium medium]